MAKRQRFHVDVPEGDLWLTGNTVSEAFLNGFQRYQQMKESPAAKPSPLFRDVFAEYQETFWKKLRASTRTNYQHQANKRIIDFAAKRLKTSEDKFFLNIERYGNTSSASIPIALDELNRAGKLAHGDYIILTAFGGGLANAACLIRW